MGNKPGRENEEEPSAPSSITLKPSRLAKAGATSLGGRDNYDQKAPSTTTQNSHSTNSTYQSSMTSLSDSSKQTKVKGDHHNTFNTTPSSSSTTKNMNTKEVSSIEKTCLVEDFSRNNNNNNNNQPFENEQIYQSIPKVPPPQTKLWEQQQQIQLEIGRQQRKNQTYQMIESTNAKFNHVINGRSAGFDPDRFKKANFSQSSSLMSNSTPTKNTFPTTSTSASSTSPLIVASSKNIYESSKPFHHDEVHSNSSQSGGSIIPPSSLSPPSSSSSSSKSYKTMKGSPMSRKQPEAQPPNSLDFLDESLMDDILQDIGL